MADGSAVTYRANLTVSRLNRSHWRGFFSDPLSLPLAGMSHGRKPPTFQKAVWLHVSADLMAGLRERARVILELVFTAAVTVPLFLMYASTQAAYEFYLECVGGLVAFVLVLPLVHLLWSWASAPRTIYYNQQKRITDLESDTEPDAAADDPQVVLPRPEGKEIAVDEARAMIQELIDTAPPGDRLNRQAVARWRTKCINYLRALLNREHDEEWERIQTVLGRVEEPNLFPAQHVKELVEKVLIWLRALRLRFNDSMLPALNKSKRLAPGDRPTAAEVAALSSGKGRTTAEKARAQGSWQAAVDQLIQGCESAMDFAAKKRWYQAAENTFDNYLVATTARRLKDDIFGPACAFYQADGQVGEDSRMQCINYLRSKRDTLSEWEIR